MVNDLVGGDEDADEYGEYGAEGGEEWKGREAEAAYDFM
jgi:hypothetical protein